MHIVAQAKATRNNSGNMDAANEKSVDLKNYLLTVLINKDPSHFPCLCVVCAMMGFHLEEWMVAHHS